MIEDRRAAGVALAGFTAFINLYTPQAILPAISGTFSASPAQTGLVVTAALVATAVVAPFIGAISDRLGRKNLIVGACLALTVPTFLIALSPTIAVMVALRFAQGLLFPAIFAVAIAYVGDECPGAAGVRASSAYALGTIFGGFLGRFAAGVATDLGGWRMGFGSIGVVTLLCTAGIALLLPREENFRATTGGWRGTLAAARAHLGNARLMATCVIGASMLFSMVAAFTYANFLLAAPPFDLRPAQLGAVFTVYLLGLLTTTIAMKLTLRFGRLPTLLICVGFAMTGVALSLVPTLPAIIAGLALLSGGMFVVQTLSLGFIAATVPRAKSAAVGMYVSAYYVGGACGGVLPAVLWGWFGWPGVAACVAAAGVAIVGLAGSAWRGIRY